MASRSALLSAASRSRLHWSWLPALAALAWVLATDHFRRVDAAAPTFTAAATALIAFACVVAQEGIRRIAMWSAGGHPAPVVLWPAGGVPYADADPPPLRAEVRGACAGPLASFVLAGIFAIVDGVGSVGAAADVLSRFNAALAVFSLIPASPLAGGALLRSALRARGQSLSVASATTARAGLALAAMLIATGAGRAATDDPRGGFGLAVAGAILGASARADAPGAPVRGRISFRTAIGSVPLILVMLVAVATLYHPPLALARPGEPFNVSADVVISGVSTSPVNGHYVAASVRIEDPSALHAFISLFRRDQYLLRRDALRPLVEDPFRPAADAEALFRLGRDYATVAAALAVGTPVELHGSGVRVVAAGPLARAAGFRPGDTIVGVDDEPIARLEQLRAIVIARPAGASFELVVERGGERFVRSIRSTVSRRSGGVPYLDMQGLTRDLRFDLPFQIRFRAEGELGSSGGLAYALAIADLLDPRDLARGRTIAATGRVDVTGVVRSIIGAIAKQWSAVQAGADLFVLAAADADALVSPVLPVAGVDSVQGAIERLLER